MVGRAMLGGAMLGGAMVGRAMVGGAMVGRATVGRAMVGRATGVDHVQAGIPHGGHTSPPPRPAAPAPPLPTPLRPHAPQALLKLTLSPEGLGGAASAFETAPTQRLMRAAADHALQTFVELQALTHPHPHPNPHLNPNPNPNPISLTLIGFESWADKPENNPETGAVAKKKFGSRNALDYDPGQPGDDTVASFPHTPSPYARLPPLFVLPAAPTASPFRCARRVGVGGIALGCIGQTI